MINEIESLKKRANCAL